MDAQDLRRRLSVAALLLTLACAFPPAAQGVEYGALGGWVRIPIRARKPAKKEPNDRGEHAAVQYASPVGVRVEVVGTKEHFEINNAEGFFVVRAPLGTKITLKITGTQLTARTPTFPKDLPPRHLVESPIVLTRTADARHLDEREIRRLVAEYRAAAARGREEGDAELAALGEESLRSFGELARGLNEEAAKVSANSPAEGVELYQTALWIQHASATDKAVYDTSLAGLFNIFKSHERNQAAWAVLVRGLSSDSHVLNDFADIYHGRGVKLPEVISFQDELLAHRSAVGLLELNDGGKTFTVAVRAGQVTRFQIGGARDDTYKVTVLNDQGELIVRPLFLVTHSDVQWISPTDGNYFVRVVNVSAATKGVTYAAAHIATAPAPAASSR